MIRTLASLEARLGRVGQRRTETVDRPCAIVAACIVGPEGGPPTFDYDRAVAEARAAMPGRRIVYALPDNGRGDGPTVWGQR